MTTQKRVVRGCILDRAEKGESMLCLSLLSPENGLLHIYQKLSRKHTSHTVDLFEEIEALIEPGKIPGQGFMKEHTTLCTRAPIAHQYETLQCASTFSGILLRNLQHTEEPDQVYALCNTALDAWATHPYPHTTLLKTLYRYCMLEGYPVQQDWLENQPGEQKNTIQAAIKSPLSQLEAEPPVSQPATENLLRWMKYHTDFALPVLA